jgi:hypothetical protein
MPSDLRYTQIFDIDALHCIGVRYITMMLIGVQWYKQTEEKLSSGSSSAEQERKQYLKTLETLNVIWDRLDQKRVTLCFPSCTCPIASRLIMLDVDCCDRRKQRIRLID